MATEETKAPAQAEAKPKEEQQTNCLRSNHPIEKISRYNRDGKYYCTKRCWSNFIKKSKTEEK